MEMYAAVAWALPQQLARCMEVGGRTLHLLHVVTCLLALTYVDSQVRMTRRPEVTDTSHQRQTSGTSGAKCTALGRRCLTTAQCQNKECVCLNGTVGEGLIECIQPDHKLCVVSADPHVRSYQEARADVNLPCQYRLTRFLTDFPTSSTRFSYCSVEVYVSNVLHKDNYYVHSVHITVGVTDLGKQVHNHFELRKYGVSDDQIYEYMTNMTKVRTVWGISSHDSINGVDIFPTYDSDNNFAVLTVPMCDVRIKYRAFDRTSKHQHLLPGITVMAPPHSQFVPAYGDYPASLCGQFSDTSSLYEDRARLLGLKSADLAVIYDVLKQQAPQTNNPMGSQCEAAMDAFAMSSNKAADMNSCGRILTVKSTRRCVVDQELQPIVVFTACLRYRKNRNPLDCQLLKAIRERCGHRMWRKPHIRSC